MRSRNVARKRTRLNSSHTDIYTLSLHDALPIWLLDEVEPDDRVVALVILAVQLLGFWVLREDAEQECSSEEDTSELESHRYLHSFPTRRSSDLASGRSRAR